MADGWINTAFASLPGTGDELFRRLWGERRLKFDGAQDVADALDEQSAGLASAALSRGLSLFIALPDLKPHRPAFLLATALIRNWWDSRNLPGSGTSNASVVYFGSQVGIRDQLRRTTVRGLRLNLADVFDQKDLRRRATTPSLNSQNTTSALPEVVTVYAPANPVAVMERYRPSWIAIDCGDAPSLPWLHPLLEAARNTGTPIIAWGQNPLSECLVDFIRVGNVFVWPSPLWSDDSKFEGGAEVILCGGRPTSVCPTVLTGTHANSLSALLCEASKLLAAATQYGTGRFTNDALAVHWRYLRSLESLAVPLDFYESESPRLWGMRSFGQIRSACAQFRAACADTSAEFQARLEEIDATLDRALKQVESTGCPLWNALCNLCIEEADSHEARLITFTSDTRKRLFLFALLARHNITEDDLREIRTWVTSLSDLRRSMHRRYLPHTSSDEDPLMPPLELHWHPILAGLPSPRLTPKLLPVFLQDEVDVLLYNHQRGSFARRQDEWSCRLRANPAKAAEILTKFSTLPPPSHLPTVRTRIDLGAAVEMDSESAKKIRVPSTSALWEPQEAAQEIASLFQDEESDGEVTIQGEVGDDALPVSDDAQQLGCAEALEITFDQNWRAFFAPDDRMNVVVNGSHGPQIEPRFVRALRLNDKVLVIHGQQRQSLYDLIISRLHKHPSIELHLALIWRWQDDVRVAYDRWQSVAPDVTEFQKSGARDIRGLLRRMNERGSELLSAPTAWLKGVVLCPLDPEDLRRVAEVLEMGFERQYYRRIAQAANRLRGLHRGLANRLNRWLEDHAAGAANQRDDDVIDEELGLRFGDLRNSLMILRVRGVQVVPGPFLRSNLGRVERTDEHG